MGVLKGGYTSFYLGYAPVIGFPEERDPWAYLGKCGDFVGTLI